MPPALTMLDQHGPSVPMVTASKSPLELRGPSDACKTSDMPPTCASTRHRPSVQPKESSGRQARMYSAVAGHTNAAAMPMPIPTTATASRHSQQFGSAGPIMAARRAGIQITTTNGGGDGGNSQDPLDQRNTWPRNGAARVKRRGGGGNTSNAPARSPLSIYGDGSFHSFTVCGAPGCKVCSDDGTAQQAAFYLSDRTEGGEGAGAGAEAGGRPGRCLIQHACEHCRMPFIPKLRDPEDVAGQQGSKDIAEGSECGGSSAASTPVEGTLAGGVSAASSFSTVADAEEEHDRDADLEFSPLVGARPRSSPRQQQPQPQQMLQANDDNCLAEEGFCSGDCKMSYMLTNLAAARRRRAAAVANAAARAAQNEARMERSRRAPRRSGVAQTNEQSAAATTTTAVRRPVQREGQAVGGLVAARARARD